jgi:hypothetical protein
MSVLSSLLVQDQIVSVNTVEEALHRQVIFGGELDTILLELRAAPEEVLVAYKAQAFSMKAVRAGDLEAAAPKAMERLPAALAQEYEVVPLAVTGDALIVAVYRPLNDEELSAVRAETGVTMVPLITSEVRLRRALHERYGVELEDRFQRLVPLLSESYAGPAFDGSRDSRPLAADTLPQMEDDGGGGNGGADQPLRPPAPPPVIPLATGLSLIEEASTRREIFDAALRVAGALLEFTAAFVLKGKVAVAAACRGDDADAERLATRPLLVEAPGVFWEVIDRQSHFVGPLTRCRANENLLRCLDRSPNSVLVVPVTVGPRVVVLLYGDNGSRPLTGYEFAALIPLARAMTSAFERLILARKGGGQDASAPPPSAVGRASRAGDEEQEPSALVQPPGEESGYDEADATAGPAGATEAPKDDRIEDSGPQSAEAPQASSAPPRPAPLEATLVKEGVWMLLSEVLSDPDQDEGSAAEPMSRAALRRHEERTLEDVPVGMLLEDPSDSAWDTPDDGEGDDVLGSDDDRAIGQSSEEISEETGAPAVGPSTAGDDERGAGVFDEPSSHHSDDGTSWEVAEEDMVASAGELPQPPDSEVVPPPTESELTAAAEAAEEVVVAVEAVVAASGADPVPATGRTDGGGRRGGHGGGYVFAARLPVLLTLGDDEGPEPSDPATGMAASWDPGSLDAPDLPEAALAQQPAELTGDLPSVIVDMGPDIESQVVVALGDGAVADAAVARLRDMGEVSIPGLIQRFPGAVNIDWSDLRSLTEPAAHGRLLAILQQFGELAVPYLVPQLVVPEPAARFCAVFLLGCIDTPDALAAVGLRLMDSNPHVVWLARSIMERAVRRGQVPEAVYGAVRSVLIGECSTTGDLRRACPAAAVLRDREAVPLLIEVLRDGGLPARGAALGALRAITGHDFGASYRRWAAWWGKARRLHRVEWLLAGLGHRDEMVRRHAAHELHEATEVDLRFPADGPRRERDRVRREYLSWWNDEGRAKFRAND